MAGVSEAKTDDTKKEDSSPGMVEHKFTLTLLDEETGEAKETKDFVGSWEFGAGLIAWDSNFGSYHLPPDSYPDDMLRVKVDGADPVPSEKRDDCPKFFADLFSSTTDIFDDTDAGTVAAELGNLSLEEKKETIVHLSREGEGYFMVTHGLDFLRGVAAFAAWTHSGSENTLFNELIKGVWIDGNRIPNPYNHVTSQAKS